MWSLKTGKLLGTFWGVHRGSVLCLKFEGDWEEGEGDDLDDAIHEVEDGEDESMEDVRGRSSPETSEASTSAIPNDNATAPTPRGERGVQIELRPRSDRRGKRGFMVTGSSDCSVCVWDLFTGPPQSSVRPSHVRSATFGDVPGLDNGASGAHGWEGSDEQEGNGEEREVIAEVRAILKGHVGGVLDLRIDKKWIVSWYDDFL